MIILRTIFRTVVFVVAIGAIVVILGTGYWAVTSQNDKTIASISVGKAGDASVVHSPQNLEEFVLGLYLQSKADVINLPISNDPSAVAFTVEVGDNARVVASRLAELGFIKDATVFRLFLQYNGMDSSLEAGDYELRRNMNMRQIAQALQKANFEEVALTIPEGWRAEQVAELLTQTGAMDGNFFLGVVRQGGGLEHPLLADRPAGASLEGYLFPDTYRLSLKSKPEDLIKRMLDTMSAKIPADTMPLAKEQGLTFYEVLILASIVEREAVLPAERPTIASVYLNRLNKKMHLQADPTVQYAMGYQAATRQWWKTPVTLGEYSGVNSPYNTYIFKGLPPGPIASPGVASINAVLHPEQTDYFFFMACGAQGAHVFAKDYETHQVNVAQCQGGK